MQADISIRNKMTFRNKYNAKWRDFYSYQVLYVCSRQKHHIVFPQDEEGGGGYNGRPVLNTRDYKYNPPPSHSNLFTQLINLKQITEAFHNEFVAKFADSYVYIFL